MQHQNTLENQEIKKLIEQPEQEIIQAQVQIQVQEIQIDMQGHPQQEVIQGQQPTLGQQTNTQAEIINTNIGQPQEQEQQQQQEQQQFQQQQQQQYFQQQQQQQFQQQQQWHQQQQQGLQFQQFQQMEFQQQQNFEMRVPTQLTPAQAVALLSTVPIPDQFCFTHEFRSQSPCFEECGGYNLEESIFRLPSIGELSFDVAFNLPSRCAEPKDPEKMAKLLSRYIPQKAIALNPDHFCRECCSNEHFFRQHTYSLLNNNVRIEFFGHVGKMYIKGVLVLEFVECIKNYSDVFQGSKFSTMPQMVIYEPQYHSSTKQTYPIRMKAQKSNCPEHPYSFLGFESIFGCCKLQRPFEIYGLKQGTCEILNRRTQNNACNSHLGFRDSFVCNFDCCNFPDYKEFEINFQNVIYIDRLKILLGLIHFNMYNKWEHTDYKGRFLLFQLHRIARKIKYGDAGQCSIF